MCRYTASGLTEDTTYEFRVMARNAAGSISEPSLPSEEVTCKDVTVSPKLDLDPNMKDIISCKAGHDFQIEAGVIGIPPPTVTWKFNGKELDSNLHTTIVNDQGTTLLKVNEAHRYDSGEYMIHLKNSAGERSMTFTAKVLDTPGPCASKLEVSGVTSSRLFLTWKAPENDGNSEVTNYVVEKRETSRLSWTMVAADQKTPSIKVNKILKNNEYIFRVRAENKFGCGPGLESDAVVAKDNFTLPCTPALIPLL